MALHVIVTPHTGHPEQFRATLIPGLHKISSRSEVVSVVSTEAGEVLAVPSRNVFTPEGLRYAQEWATQTHKSIYDIRVPDALAVQ